MSDSAEDYETGWESGYKSGVRETTRILRDLIADLRALNQNRDGGMWADDVHDATDRTEARLREVGE